jgi:hypothetical protein
MENADLNRLVEMRVEAIGKRQELDRNYKTKRKQIDALVDQIDTEILKIFNERGETGAKTPHGTVSRITKITPTVNDWGAFYDYIQKNNALHLLQRRIAQRNAVEEMEESGSALPGVELLKSYTVRVTKAKGE